MTDQRKEFEAWARDNKHVFATACFSGQRKANGKYWDEDEESAWQVWQATRAKKVLLPDAEAVKASGIDKYADGWNSALVECTDAIRAAGYEVE
jgi:hypothetical protein